MIQAVIVPSARHPDYLAEADSLAFRHGLDLIVLASGECDPGVARRQVHGEVLETGWEREEPCPVLPGYIPRDIAAKRDFGVLLARQRGYEHVLFTDDDIFGISRDCLDWAETVLQSGSWAAGFKVADWPDNSVVRHAERAAGVHVPVAMSGGAVALDPSRFTGHTPDIYGEDWIFFLPAHEKGKLAYPGPAVRQLGYDPYLPGRAAAEEAGDLIAERVRMPGAEPLREDWWEDQLQLRKEVIAGIAHRTSSPFILASLREAESVRQQLSPEILVGWVRAWKETSA